MIITLRVKAYSRTIRRCNEELIGGSINERTPVKTKGAEREANALSRESRAPRLILSRRRISASLFADLPRRT